MNLKINSKKMRLPTNKGFAHIVILVGLLALIITAVVVYIYKFNRKTGQASTSRYLTQVTLPSCDSNDPKVKIISNNADLPSLRDPNKTVFCVKPGFYSAVSLAVNGTSSAPRYIRYFSSSSSTTSPWRQDASQRAIFDHISLSASYWVIDGIVIAPSDANIAVTGPFTVNGNQNIANNILVEKGWELVRFQTGSYNTIQNSVVRDSQRRPQDDSHCILNTRAKHTHVVNNEIYNCTDGFHQLANQDATRYPDWSADGTIIDSNEIYITPVLYATCSNRDPNRSLNTSGACSCAEDGIDLKNTTTKSNPTAEDTTIISNNVLYGFRKTHDTCGGSGSFASGIDMHINSPKNIIVENNVFFDMPQAVAMTGLSNAVIRNNFMFNINDRNVGQGSVAFFANSGNNVEIYNNTVTDTLGNDPVYLRHHNQARNFDIRNNLFVNAGVAKAFSSNVGGGFENTSYVGYNGYFGSVSYQNVLAASTVFQGSREDAKLGSRFCTTVKKLTGPTQKCFENVVPQAGSPAIDHGFNLIDSRFNLNSLLGISVLSTDLVGRSRIGNPDLGAFEYLAPTPSPTQVATPIPTRTVSPTSVTTPAPSAVTSPSTASCSYGPYSIPGQVLAKNYMCGGEAAAYHDTEAENLGGEYRIYQAVDIKTSTKTNEQYVGWTRDGEWLKYLITNSATANFDIKVSVGINDSTGKIRFKLDDHEISGVLNVPNTGSWLSFQDVTIPNVNITSGVHTLTLEFVGDGNSSTDNGNVNQIEFIKK